MTARRRKRIERYIDEWKRQPSTEVVIGDTLSPPSRIERANLYAKPVLMALETDGSAEALVLCERLAAKIRDRCRADAFATRRVFGTPEDAITNDLFLALQTAPRCDESER